MPIPISTSAHLAYFEHAPVTLYGHACRMSRTGYAGDHCYSGLCRRRGDHRHLGQSCGRRREAVLMSPTLDKVRIEAWLLFYGYDMAEKNTPWDPGLGSHSEQIHVRCSVGKEALMAAKGAERMNNVCLDIDQFDKVDGGETLSLNGKDAGVIRQNPAESHRLGNSLALAHVCPGIAAGSVLAVSGEGLDYHRNRNCQPDLRPHENPHARLTDSRCRQGNRSCRAGSPGRMADVRRVRRNMHLGSDRPDGVAPFRFEASARLQTFHPAEAWLDSRALNDVADVALF